MNEVMCSGPLSLSEILCSEAQGRKRAVLDRGEGGVFISTVTGEGEANWVRTQRLAETHLHRMDATPGLKALSLDPHSRNGS